VAQREAKATFTTKQRLFIAEFLVDGNGARAAISAGYAKANAKQIAFQVLSNPAVAAEIDRRTAARMRRLEIKGESVVQELGRLAFANMADYITLQKDGSPYINVVGLSREQMAAIADITVDEYVEGRGEEQLTVLSQHLGTNKHANALRRHLNGRGIDPAECRSLELVAYGPINPEADGMDKHLPLRNQVAALEKALCDALIASRYDVLNSVHSRATLDQPLWGEVRAAFASRFPALSGRPSDEWRVKPADARGATQR